MNEEMLEEVHAMEHDGTVSYKALLVKPQKLKYNRKGALCRV